MKYVLNITHKQRKAVENAIEKAIECLEGACEGQEGYDYLQVCDDVAEALKIDQITVERIYDDLYVNRPPKWETR